MSILTKLTIPDCLQRREGLSQNKGSSLRGLLFVAISGLSMLTASAAPSLTAPETVKPAGTPAAELTTLTAQSNKFTWTKGGTDVQGWDLWLGSRQGFSDISRNDGIGKDTLELTLNVPNDPVVLYVRLRWRVGGVEQWADYAYNGFFNQHFITSPAPGSTISPATPDGCFAPPSATFKWNVVPSLGQPQRWWLYVASTNAVTPASAADIHNSGEIAATDRSYTVPNIPTNGQPIYVTLWSDQRAADKPVDWKFTQYTYQTVTLPGITSPAAGQKLTGTTGAFTLNPNGLAVEYWWVYAGRTPQQFDYLSDGFQDGSVTGPNTPGQVLNVNFSNLPNDGSAVFVTVFWRLFGEDVTQWKCREYVYEASAGPTITAPAKKVGDDPLLLPTSLTQDQVFTWSPNGTVVTGWQLYLNTTGNPGDSDVFKKEGIPAGTLSWPVPAGVFKTNGQTIHAFVRYSVNGGLEQSDFVGAATCSWGSRKIPFVENSSIGKCFTSFRGNELTVNWNDGALGNVVNYWLYVGSTLNGTEYLNSGLLGADVTSANVNLPTDGSDVHFTLFWRTAGAPDPSNPNQAVPTQFVSRDFVLTNPSCPEIVAPAPGSTIDKSTLDVTVDLRGTTVSATAFTVSAVAPSGGDAKNPNPAPAADRLDASPIGGPANLTFTTNNVPLDGNPVYVTFWYQTTATPGWKFRTTVYTASKDESQPELTKPDPTKNFDATTFTFEWKANSQDVFGWWLYVADDDADNGRVGKSNVHNSGLLAANDLDEVVTNLPNGKNYVRLWWQDADFDWNIIDYVITNDAGAPAPGPGNGPNQETP